MALDPTFICGNYVEACLWAGLGVVALAKRNSTWSFALAAALILFGVSDIVETRTGAWYEPWWLLVWKIACVLLIAVSGVGILRARRRKSNAD